MDYLTLVVSLSLSLPVSLPNKDREYKPAKPTKEKMILVSAVPVPNKLDTRSNRKNPINPQFIAPIITNTSAVLSNAFNIYISFLIKSSALLFANSQKLLLYYKKII
jgi:hypothetical protein